MDESIEFYLPIIITHFCWGWFKHWLKNCTVPEFLASKVSDEIRYDLENIFYTMETNHSLCIYSILEVIFLVETS